MAGQRQFTLKGLFAITAVLSMLLGMFVSGSRVLIAVGWMSVILIVAGCVGFLINGRKGAEIGVFIAVCVCAFFPVAVVLAYIVVGLFTVHQSLPA